MVVQGGHITGFVLLRSHIQGIVVRAYDRQGELQAVRIHRRVWGGDVAAQQSGGALDCRAFAAWQRNGWREWVSWGGIGSPIEWDMDAMGAETTPVVLRFKGGCPALPVVKLQRHSRHLRALEVEAMLTRCEMWRILGELNDL